MWSLIGDQALQCTPEKAQYATIPAGIAPETRT